MKCAECGIVPQIPSEIQITIRAFGESGEYLSEFYSESDYFCSNECAVNSSAKMVSSGEFFVEGAHTYETVVSGGGVLMELFGVKDEAHIHKK